MSRQYVRREWMMRILHAPAVALVLAGVLAVSHIAAQPAASCTPVLTPIAFHRGLPHAYADQGLASLPKVYPKHVLLAQRRAAHAGPVTYSLLVYRKDAADSVTIEGVALHELSAWEFTATCESRLAWDGLVTTLERIDALPRERAGQ